MSHRERKAMLQAQPRISRSEGLVFVIDADMPSRESAERLIRRQGWRVETFATAAEFLALHTRDAPCCLVLDVDLPDMSGLELQRRMVELGSTMPVIFIGSDVDISVSVRAMKAGALEFLTKPFAADDLLVAVADAIDRSRYRHRREAELSALRARYDSLTPRERQVMGLVASGLLNKQVGGELGTSVVTVKAQRGQVMRKMKVNSLADLVRMAATLQLPVAGRSHAHQSATSSYSL
jgi:FixJ family two-component response regulator